MNTLTAAAIGVIAWAAFAAGNPDVTRNTLVGADVAISDAIQTSGLILVAKVASVGPPLPPTAPGQATYPVAVAVVGNPLKGRSGTRELTIFVTVRNFEKIRESPPEADSSYVFFVEEHGDRLSAYKLLNGDGASIAEVRQKIDAGR